MSSTLFGQESDPSGKKEEGKEEDAEPSPFMVIDPSSPERMPITPVTPVRPTNPESDAPWETSPVVALRQARMEMKPMLLLFTASWNQLCQSLSTEVYASRSFNEYAKGRLVLCYLNYQRNLTSNSPAMQEVKERYGVHGYPSLLFFHPDGTVVGELTGYRSGRPVDYFEELKARAESVEEAVRLTKEGMATEGYRIWTGEAGQEIFARIEERTASQLILAGAYGQEWSVRVSDLSRKDREYLASVPFTGNAPGAGERQGAGGR